MRAIVMAGIVLLGASACAPKGGDADADSETAAAPAASAPAAQVVNFVARDFQFEGPSSIPAGLTTVVLKNEGPGYHHMQLVRLDDGMTLEDFEAAMAKMAPGAPPPAWLHPAGGVNPPEPGAEAQATFMLEPGNYGVVCFVDIPDHVPHVMKGMAKALTVTPSDAPAAAEPTEDLTLTLADYSFAWSAMPTAGHHMVKVVNAGPQPHEMVLFRLKDGKTMDDFQKWGATFEGEVPVTFHGGPANMMPGEVEWVPLDFEPGNYVMACFYYDKTDGQGHIMHGMVLPFTIT